MAKNNGKLKISNIILGAIFGLLILLGWGTWKAYSGQSLEEWIRETDLPIAAQLNTAANLFGSGNFGEATVHFTNAYDLALEADNSASYPAGVE